MTADPRARWAERLGVPVDAPADVAASAFLRALPGDLIPSAELVAATNALAGTALPLDPDAVEQSLRDEVDAFAANYWARPPAERLLAWDDLSRRGAAPVRLRELEPGLDAAAPALDDPVAEELAELFRSLFVLPPRARAIRRAEWLLARADDMDRWRAALAIVQRDAPALVTLEPGLRSALGPAFDPAALAAGANAPQVSEAVAAATRQQYEPSNAHTTRPERVLAGSLIGGCGPIALIVLINVLATLFRTDPRPSRIHEPAPLYGPQGTPSLRRQFTAAEVAEFQQYELDKSTRKDVLPPRAYIEWRLAGGPLGTGNVKAPTAAFTAEDVAKCEQYERITQAGVITRAPDVYEAWVRAGRPQPLQPEPGPNEVRIHLDGLQIASCARYERFGLGSVPVCYGDWVRAGKPTASGYFIVPKPAQQP